MNYTTSQDFKDARLVGLKALYEAAGSGAPYIVFYDGPQPAGGAAIGPDNHLLATAVLAPTATFAGHQLVISQADPSGDLVLVQGDVSWGRMFNGANVWMLDGDAAVVGADVPGVFQVSATIGTRLFLGAHLILGPTVIV